MKTLEKKKDFRFYYCYYRCFGFNVPAFFLFLLLLYSFLLFGQSLFGWLTIIQSVSQPFMVCVYFCGYLLIIHMFFVACLENKKNNSNGDDLLIRIISSIVCKNVLFVCVCMWVMHIEHHRGTKNWNEKAILVWMNECMAWILNTNLNEKPQIYLCILKNPQETTHICMFWTTKKNLYNISTVCFVLLSS